MKSFSNLLKIKNQQQKKIIWDEKGIFLAIERVIKKEYGDKGWLNIKPNYLKNGEIFLKFEKSIWAHEILMHKKELINKINQELRSEEILNIKISN